MNESKKDWFPIVCIVCGIIMVVACIFAIWITVQNSKYAAEIKDLKSEIGQAYFIEEGTVISACNAYQWHLEGVRIAILRNKAENEYVVLTIFGREQNANTVVY